MRVPTASLASPQHSVCELGFISRRAQTLQAAAQNAEGCRPGCAGGRQYPEKAGPQVAAPPPEPDLEIAERGPEPKSSIVTVRKRDR
jgi:hypothetical protein